jgi:transcriptional regulator with XRE-family HTH domain
MLAERLKERREQLGYSKRTVATIVGTTQSIYIKWEKGEITPSTSAVIKLAKALDVQADWLLELAHEVLPMPPECGEKLGEHIYKVNGKMYCNVAHCGWRVNCGDGKFYCPGAGCMREQEGK